MNTYEDYSKLTAGALVIYHGDDYLLLRDGAQARIVEIKGGGRCLVQPEGTVGIQVEVPLDNLTAL